MGEWLKMIRSGSWLGARPGIWSGCVICSGIGCCVVAMKRLLREPVCLVSRTLPRQAGGIVLQLMCRHPALTRPGSPTAANPVALAPGGEPALTQARDRHDYCNVISITPARCAPCPGPLRPCPKEGDPYR